MSSAGGTILRYSKSSVALGGTFGTAIASPPFKTVRITTDGLKGNYKVVESQELVSGFDVAGFRRVGLDAGGQLGFEFVYGNLDDFLESLFFSTWTCTPQRFNSAADTEIAGIVASTGVITILAASAGNVNRVGTFAVGHMVRRTGFTAAGNNGLSTVTAASGTTLTIPTAGLVDEAAPPQYARLKAVGIEAPNVGDISISTAGLGTGEVAIITGVGIDFTALGIVAGMPFKASGFATAADNGWYRALNVTATRIGVDRAPTGVATDTAAAVKVRLWLPDYLRNGTAALTWFDIERDLPQLTVPEWHYFLSMVPATWNLQLSPQAILNNTLEFVGSKRTTTAVSRASGATTVTVDTLGAVPRTGEMFDTSSNVAEIKTGNTKLVDVVTQATWQISNGANGLPVVGNLGAGRIVRPRFRPTLTLTSYYDSRGLLANLENDTAVGLSSILTDPVGTRAFAIDYPSAKISSGDLDGIQVDSEINQPLTFGAYRDPAGFGYSAQLARWEEFA